MRPSRHTEETAQVEVRYLSQHGLPGTTGRSEAPFGAKFRTSRKWSEEVFGVAKEMSKLVDVLHVAQNTKAGKVWPKGSRRHPSVDLGGHSIM